MHENLTRMITELFAKPQEGKDLSSRIQLLGDEVRKAFESEQTLYGKFCGLLESLRTIIPDEKLRYQAALQALSTTAKVNRQEIIRAINGQLEELKMLEKGLMPSLPGLRDGLTAMQARSQELRSEMARLRERMAQLESEEKAILAGMATREKDMEQAERAARELFVNIGAEIASLSRKVEDLTAEGTAPRPGAPAAQSTLLAPPPVPPKELPKSTVTGAKKGAGEPTIEIMVPPPPQDTKFQKKCPMCGGQMSLLELENMWQCFACAHEESTGAVQQNSAPASHSDIFPDPAPTSQSSFVEPLASMVFSEQKGAPRGLSPSGGQSSTKKKPCPACRKKMYWYPDEKAWRCPSCRYERRL